MAVNERRDALGYSESACKVSPVRRESVNGVRSCTRMGISDHPRCGNLVVETARTLGVRNIKD